MDSLVLHVINQDGPILCLCENIPAGLETDHTRHSFCCQGSYWNAAFYNVLFVVQKRNVRIYNVNCIYWVLQRSRVPEMKFLFLSISLRFHASRPRHFKNWPSSRCLYDQLPIPLAMFGCMSTSWNLSQLCSCILWSPTDQECLASRGATPQLQISMVTSCVGNVITPPPHPNKSVA